MTLLRTAVTIVIMYSCLRYGVIWDSKVNPIPNATVSINGQKSTGYLAYTWTGQQSLETNGGSKIVFDEGVIDYIEYSAESLPVYKHWRSFLPLILCFAWWLSSSLPELNKTLRKLKVG